MKNIDLDSITPEEYEIARLTIENILIDFRDNRISVLRNNGLVIKEKDGTASYIVRMATAECIRIGIETIWKSRVSK